MSFGRTLVVQPAGTDHLLRVRSRLSSSRQGLVYYSDGYMEGPHFPPVCQFLMHDPVTGTPFFPMDADEVGSGVYPTNSRGGEVGERDSIPMAKLATCESYAHAIEFMVEKDNTERLSILRHHWWWVANNPRWRNPALSLAPAARANMEAILDETTDVTDYARLLRAELYRELGDFGKALRELVSPFSHYAVDFATDQFLMATTKDGMLSSYRRNPYP